MTDTIRTETVLVLDLVDVDIAGRRAQIVRPAHVSPAIPERWRTMLDVKLRTVGGEDWVYWRWTPETADGRGDCGYSGMTVELARSSERALELEVAP